MIADKNKGFTLIELTVVMSIFILMFILGGNFNVTTLQATRFTSDQGEAIIQARKAINNISKDVREASCSERGDYPIGHMATQNFIWYGDVNNDNLAEKINYLIDGSDLLRVITGPGVNNNYPDSEKSTSTIAYYMNNQTESIFKYYDADNNETAAINEVRLINVNLKINVTPLVAPNDYYVETDIQLRNLKDNL